VNSLFRYARRFGVDLALARVHLRGVKILKSGGVIVEFGEHHVYDTVRDTVDVVTGADAMIDAPSVTRDVPGLGGG
jgi:hypothetical protein